MPMSPHQMGPVILKASLFPTQAHIFFSLIFHYDFVYQSTVDLQCCVLPTSFMYVFFGRRHATQHAARGILAPQPGIKPLPSARDVSSLNHWAAREGPHIF